MAQRRSVWFLVLIVNWTESSGEETCLLNDLNAMMVRLRTFTASTQNATAVMQVQISELQNKTQQQNQEIEALQAKITELEMTKARLENEITASTKQNQNETTRLTERDTDLEKSIQNLTLINQQQDALIERLRFGNSTDKVAFIARHPNNDNPPNGHILVFTTEELDTQSSYNSSTGKFTAPVAGTYLFSVQICIRKNSGIYYTIRSSKKSKNIHAAVFHGGNYVNSECSSVTSVVILEKSESVWVQSGATVGNNNEIYLDVDAWNMFLGTLLV